MINPNGPTFRQQITQGVELMRIGKVNFLQNESRFSAFSAACWESQQT